MGTTIIEQQKKFFLICQVSLVLVFSRITTHICVDRVYGISLDLLQEEINLPALEVDTGVLRKEGLVKLPWQLLSELWGETQRLNAEHYSPFQSPWLMCDQLLKVSPWRSLNQ